MWIVCNITPFDNASGNVTDGSKSWEPVQIAGRADIADTRVGRVMHASEIFHRETPFQGVIALATLNMQHHKTLNISRETLNSKPSR